jgi:hypothetical protein
MKLRTSLILILVFSCGPSLWAVDPCDHDRAKVCGGVTAGEGRIHDCMMQKQDQLSPACRKNVLRADELARNVENLCATDIKTFCSQYSAQPLARTVSCLREKHSQLQPTCRKAFDEYDRMGYRVRQ